MCVCVYIYVRVYTVFPVNVTYTAATEWRFVPPGMLRSLRLVKSYWRFGGQPLLFLDCLTPKMKALWSLFIIGHGITSLSMWLISNAVRTPKFATTVSVYASPFRHLFRSCWPSQCIGLFRKHYGHKQDASLNSKLYKFLLYALDHKIIASININVKSPDAGKCSDLMRSLYKKAKTYLLSHLAHKIGCSMQTSMSHRLALVSLRAALGRDVPDS
jgi:hypothetical protein